MTKNLGSNVNFLLRTQLQFKILHWQTKGYARHKAFGEIYDSLDDLIDEFVEVSMGKYGRFVLTENEKTITLQNLTEITIQNFLQEVRNKLIDFTEQVSQQKDSDLLNIRDEMLSQVNKLSYLLTLE